MADTKLADMSAAASLASGDLLYVEQSGSPKKTTPADVATFVASQATAVSALSAAGALTGTEVMPGVQSGGSVKITPNQISTFLGTVYQPLASNLTSWAAITRASGFDTFTATPSSANLAALITNETGTGALVFGTSPTISTALTLTGATETTSNPVVNATQTWNSAGVTFTGMLLNVTSTASAAASLLIDLQVAGASKFKVGKTGILTLNDGTRAPALIPFTGSVAGIEISKDGTTGNPGELMTSVMWSSLDGSNLLCQYSAYGVQLRSTASFSWSNSSSSYSGADIQLQRVSAGILGQYIGTQSQGYQLYDTFTDASNYRRLSLTFSSTTALIATEGAGTGTRGNLAFGSAALATNATTGYIMVPSCAGAPTGVPANIPTGQIALHYDTTNNKIWAYNGSWRGIIVA